MDTNTLKKFAQEARNQLRSEVGARMQQVLGSDSVELREKAAIVRELKDRIGETSRERVVEEVAYIWFNRLCALRYMDLNGFNRIGVVSPAPGATQPEILQEAKGGYVDEDLPLRRAQLQGYLSGSLPADNPQQEAYRMLLVASCNRLAEVMPFLFERIEDYTELLMPLDLLSESSILHAVREALTAETCRDVEVIGWLYQFYISEKKDEVMARKSAVPSEDIPAVTQLFTPHWIVRYMVENSLGRLWLLNHPQSKLAEKMDFYIKPVEAESEFLQVASPEELKLCDPACGSGHILTYAFDLLVAIYEEMGYDPVQIPALILEKNLYGIEIDRRAGSLAAFALYMKAYERDRRFARRGVFPNICVMEDITFSAAEIKAYIDKLGSDLFTQDLWEGLKQFEDATTYGSLIRPKIRNAQAIQERMAEKGVFSDLFLFETNRKVQKVLEMAAYLSPRYQVVVANPPYFGGGMDAEYKQFAKDYYPESKSDTFAMFTERNLELAMQTGFIGMITMQSWMFLSSYEALRTRLLERDTVLGMAHLGARAFDTIGGEVVSTTMFVLQNVNQPGYKGIYLRLVDGNSEEEKIAALQEAIANPECGWFFRASAADFKKIPGSPIAYWVSKDFISIVNKTKTIGDLYPVKEGLNTGDNDLFLRFWYEVKTCNFRLETKNREEAKESKLKWFPCNKGGGNTKWYGQNYYIINWFNDGEQLFSHPNSTMRNVNYYFQEGITWSGLSSSGFSGRYFPTGYVFNSAGRSMFPYRNELFYIIGLLNSVVGSYFFSIVAPTLSFTVGNVASMPVVKIFIKEKEQIDTNSKNIISISKHDWDSYDTSWDFTDLPLLKGADLPLDTLLKQRYQELRAEWQEMVDEMLRLEEENNRIFIEAYGLQDELTPEVPLEEITLTCNPYYRYPDTKSRQYSDAEREARLLEDTMKEFLSYAVGCMFGRYSLDKPGLVLANQGETLQDYLNIISLSHGERGGVRAEDITFLPDEDNVIPVLEGDWFPDDITARFKAFLKVTFGEAHYEQNLAFIEEALGKDVRAYFVRDFYKDHVQTYKKRPIYWLFSSPKGSFNALIYMHRYQPDTLSVLLNKYLREYQTKLRARRGYLESVERSPGASQKDKTAAMKEIRQIEAVLVELRDYENEVIYPLATEQIDIDLDDGVKVNYEKFGKALKGI